MVFFSGRKEYTTTVVMNLHYVSNDKITWSKSCFVLTRSRVVELYVPKNITQTIGMFMFIEACYFRCDVRV